MQWSIMTGGEKTCSPLYLKSENMEQLWEYFYSLMLLDISRCKGTAVTETEHSECCYRVAINYWEKVKDIWSEVKPQFTSHIEYYLILNQGLLFIPDDPFEATNYWKDEEQRLQRFCNRNEDFIRYLESKSHHNDGDYFLQRNNRHALLPQERIYADADCRSSHDWLIRSWLANKMYNDFVKKRLKVLHDG